MTTLDDGLYAALLQRGMSRRSFIKFCGAMAAVLALPATYAPRIAAAVAAAPRIPVLWLRGQDCGGESTAFLGASNPTAAELMLDLMSVEYHPALMAPSGTAADRSLQDTQSRYPNGYIVVVEGGIPIADDGVTCTIGGRAFSDVVREVSAGALATIAVGSCAFDGGLPAATGGPTGAVGVAQVISGGSLVNLPGCPVNAENLAATLVHYLTFTQLPATDSRQRPLFAYGSLVHNQCERRAHFEFGEFVLAWGDEASQKGWCLYKMGCKGPETSANCPTARYAGGTSWPVKAGHGCVGCTMPRFWDAMSPFYRRLPSPLPFAPTVSADQVGQAMVGGVAVLTMAHGTASYVRHRRHGAAERRGGVVGGSQASAQPGEAPMGVLDPVPASMPTPIARAEPLPEPAPPPVPSEPGPSLEPPELPVRVAPGAGLDPEVQPPLAAGAPAATDGMAMIDPPAPADPDPADPADPAGRTDTGVG